MTVEMKPKEKEREDLNNDIYKCISLFFFLSLSLSLSFSL